MTHYDSDTQIFHLSHDDFLKEICCPVRLGYMMSIEESDDQISWNKCSRSDLGDWMFKKRYHRWCQEVVIEQTIRPS